MNTAQNFIFIYFLAIQFHLKNYTKFINAWWLVWIFWLLLSYKYFLSYIVFKFTYFCHFYYCIYLFFISFLKSHALEVNFKQRNVVKMNIKLLKYLCCWYHWNVEILSFSSVIQIFYFGLECNINVIKSWLFTRTKINFL